MEMENIILTIAVIIGLWLGREAVFKLFTSFIFNIMLAVTLGLVGIEMTFGMENAINMFSFAQDIMNNPMSITDISNVPSNFNALNILK